MAPFNRRDKMWNFFFNWSFFVGFLCGVVLICVLNAAGESVYGDDD